MGVGTCLVGAVQIFPAQVLRGDSGPPTGLGRFQRPALPEVPSWTPQATVPPIMLCQSPGRALGIVPSFPSPSSFSPSDEWASPLGPRSVLRHSGHTLEGSPDELLPPSLPRTWSVRAHLGVRPREGLAWTVACPHAVAHQPRGANPVLPASIFQAGRPAPGPLREDHAPGTPALPSPEVGLGFASHSMVLPGPTGVEGGPHP